MNDMNEKTNDLYDCDPADCNGYNQTASEYDSNAQDEQNAQKQNTDNESAAQDEQAAATDEQPTNDYAADTDAQSEQSEQSQNTDYESAAQDEQAAATDEQPTNDYAADTDAQSEQSEQNVKNTTDGKKCERNVFDDPQTDEYMPSDEQAATTDGCGCSLNTKDIDCSTITAQSRCALDDYEIISDVLGTEKNLVKLYSTAICECAEENLIDTVRQNMCACAADQHKTFMFMSKHDMYPTEEAPEKKIKQAKEQFCPLCK